MESKEEMNILEDFKEDFKKIKQMGFIDSKRFHDTGIGKTFEDFIGVIENNKSSADYKGILELKSARELSEAMITLFTKSPDPRGVNTKLKNIFGYPDEEFPSISILHTTFSAIRFNTSKGGFGFLLDIDYKKRKIFIRVKNLKTGKIDKSIEAFYPFENLIKKLENKCKYIIFISAEHKKIDGKEFFKFNKAILLSGLTFDKFLAFIEKGFIKYDFRLGIFRSGRNRGKKHDHGSGFRVLKKDLNKVFIITEID